MPRKRRPYPYRDPQFDFTLEEIQAAHARAREHEEKVQRAHAHKRKPFVHAKKMIQMVPLRRH